MKSIRTKLLVMFTLIILAVALALGFVTIHVVSSDLLEDANSDLSTMAQSEAKYIASVRDGDLKYIEGLAQNGILLDGDISWQEKTAFMEAEAQRAGYITFGYADPQGNSVILNHEATKGSIANASFFQKALAGESNTSDIIVNTETEEAVVYYATPIYLDGVLQGVFFGEKDGTTLCDIVTAVSYKSTGYAYVINDEGVTVGHKNHKLVMIRDNDIENAKTDASLAELGALTEKMIREKSGNGSYTYEGVEKIAAFAPVEGSPWIVILGVESAEILSEVNAIRNILVIMVIAAVLFGIVVTFFASGAIAKPIKKITNVAKEIADGNFNVELDIHSKDEIGQLAEAFDLTIEKLVNYQGYIDEVSDAFLEISKGNLKTELYRTYEGQFKKIKVNMEAMLKNLNITLSNINQAALQVDSGADQVANGAQALSQGATEQASAIEQLSASIAEITEQIKTNAGNAAQAKDKAELTGKEMTISNEKMNEMTEAMEEITRKSADISKIIKIIEDIAFQTNILALNAAVEAARAGDAGKGFAVVADEVRNLASKSAEAAKQTTNLIEETLQAVNKGESIAGETAASLERSSGDVAQSIGIIDQIAENSQQQSQSIAQISLGVEQVSSVVQTNAATAQESAAASEELSGQSEMLREMISRFRLKNETQQDFGGHNTLSFETDIPEDFRPNGTAMHTKY